jgi:SAM-dependent methyltransferase
MTSTVAEACYRPNGHAIHVPDAPVAHRNDEYDQAGFQLLLDMQERHFWYAGRHRFLLHAFRRQQSTLSARGLHAVDLGGGCGGWVKYLKSRAGNWFEELALADSSLRALELARPVVGADVPLYQVDLLNLGWRERWDVAFLLDVLEHIPEDIEVLRQVREALRPGGLLFVTTPALQLFWSRSDELGHHVRRYSRGDFRRLAARAGFELRLSRYFMFYLSPLVLLSRRGGPDPARASAQEVRDYLHRSHRVPAAPVNRLLGAVFALETPIGQWLPFPWGTSILGVFRKPAW